ncbi:LLM class flavin-dependent oxidoreductase [Isosphaeraceae bacterium EP7]
MFTIGLTDHLEGPSGRPSSEIFAEVAELVRLADELGAEYAWFAEHHGHAHLGHLPTPLLFALHLAGQTRRIRLGTAIICLNLHHPLDVAEQVAVADALTGGRIAAGFGSGSTPEESDLFKAGIGLGGGADERDRHSRFEEALRVIAAAWGGDWDQGVGGVPAHTTLPAAGSGLIGRSWQAVNSVGSARIAGSFGFNVLFSHLRTPEQYREYVDAYRASGGRGKVAANRPVFVGPDDATAFETAEPALRTIWRRFRDEGKIPGETPEPDRPQDLCGHPINFIVGGPQSVARQLIDLHRAVPYDVANVEVRWAGLTHEQVRESLRRLLVEVVPLVRAAR